MTVFNETDRQRNFRAIGAWENEGGAPRRASPGDRNDGGDAITGRARTRASGGMSFLNARNAPRYRQRIRLPVAGAHSAV